MDILDDMRGLGAAEVVEGSPHRGRMLAGASITEEARAAAGRLLEASGLRS